MLTNQQIGAAFMPQGQPQQPQGGPPQNMNHCFRYCGYYYYVDILGNNFRFIPEERVWGMLQLSTSLRDWKKLVKGGDAIELTEQEVIGITDNQPIP